MKIKVLGTGCANCRNLEQLVRRTVDELKLDAQVEKEEDIMKIIAYGVRRTPAIVIDEKVVLYGRIPSENELISLLTTQITQV
jgi:small redox-active disulfide protein 2